MAKKILVIDDEEIITKSLQKLLKKEGYDVAVAKNGQEALEKIKAGDFNLLISDVRMPQMDGVETVEAIRQCLKEKGKSAVPEILITGYADEEKYKSAIDLKVADYILKPFDIAELLQVIQRNIK